MSSSITHFNLIRISIGNEKGCPGGEREQYQLQNGFYTTSNRIPNSIWEGSPTHAIVYYSKNFPDKWCAGAFKGIYTIDDKIDITTQDEFEKLYPDGWWGRSSNADLYSEKKWKWEHWEEEGRRERGYKLTQLTDARIPKLSGCKNIRGDMCRMIQTKENNIVKQMIDKCEAGDYDGAHASAVMVEARDSDEM